MPLPEIDRNDPGYQRHCIGAGCTGSFNVLDGAPRWRWAPRLFTGALCPVHAPPLVSGEHWPAWIRDGDGPATGIRCSCGTWSWSPDGPATLGEHQGQFMKHIEEQLEVTRG